MANQTDIRENASATILSKEEFIVFEINQSNLHKTHRQLKIQYTIKKEDYKRLNRKGVLKVYNINEPVEIPVIRLLGKWKSSHIGVTLLKRGEEWQIQGGKAASIADAQRSFLGIVKRLIIKPKPLNNLKEFLDVRMNENSLLNDA